MKILNKYRNLSKKDKNILKHILGAFVVKGFALIISFFTMPAYLHFFHDSTALGLWFTVLSVLTWILNFDIGIGNGLRNKLTESLSKGENNESKKYISSAYISIAALVFLSMCVFFVVFNYIDWNIIFNISTEIVSSGALLKSVLITFAGIMLQFFLRTISSILYALQLSSINNVLSLCTSGLTLVGVLVAPSSTNDNNVILMAIIHLLAVILPLIVVTIIVFSTKKMRKLMPSFRCFSFEHAKRILSLGGAFFFVQIMYMIIMNTNTYLIGIFDSQESVVNYQIYYKLFSLGSLIFTLTLTPIWSSVTKAITEKDLIWVRKLYKKLLLLLVIAILCELLLVVILQPVINIWLGDEAIIVDYFYAISFVLMEGCMMLNGVLSSFANGMGKLKTQVVCFTIGAVLKILLSYVLVAMLSSWIGVVLSNVFALGLYCVFQPLTINRDLRELEKIITQKSKGEKENEFIQK